MDCICIGKQTCLGAVAGKNDSYFILSKEYELIEIDISTSHVKNRVQVPKSKIGNGLVTLKYHRDHIYLFWGQSEYLVFGLDPPEFLLNVSLGGKKPYVPYSTAFTDEAIIFSTISHSNIYVFPTAQISSLGFVKKPTKLKLPSKVIANSITPQPQSQFLIAACSDGLIRVWDLQTNEEILPIIDSGSDQRASKKTISSIMKKNILHQVNCLEFNNSGTRLLSGDDAGVIYLISEQGILGVAWVKEDTFIGLIKEGTLLMMQIGENLSSHSKRNLPAKIRIISQSLFSIPSDLISAIPKQEFRCLSSMSNNTILSMWPSHSVKYVFHLSLINSQRTSDGSPIVSSLTQQSIDSLIPSPNSFPAAFFFISNNEILEYSILEGKTSTLSSLATESSLYLNLDVRPRSGGNPIDILVSKESKGSKSLQLIRKKGDDVINKIYPGIAGVILGEENAIGENLIIVAEDRSTVSLFYLDDEEFMTFSLNMKIKNAYWTPLQYGFSVLYETLHEHSLRLSKSVRTGRTEDVDLSEKDVFKLDYDEILTCLKWHTINNKLALGTSKRIIILDSDLQMIEQCNLERPRWSVPSSVYWFGNVLMFSRREGVYYCSDEIKLLFQTLSPSIICGVLNDRVLIASSSKGTEIQARPVTMLEPLLLGVLKIKPDTEKINKIVRMMSTPLITENLIALLLNSGYPDAAWFLVEQIESNYISLELRVKIMKELNLFDEIFEKLLHKKYLEDPSEYKAFLIELNSDHNWKLEKTLISEMAKYFEQKGQILKAAKCLELSTNYEELDLLLLQQGINPGLYSPQSDQNIYTSPPALPDLKMNIKPPSLSQIKLGFGERPFSQRINNQEINPANADNLGQWFGWDSLKQVERIAPQFMDHNEFEEEKDGIKELTEEEALIVYLRCDEGRGTQLGNVMNTKFYFVSDSMWGTILEEGEPMEYDDKWGKRCQPNYDLLFSSDTRLVVDGLAQLKNWTVELWCKFDSIMQGSIFKSGTFECRIDNGNIKCSNNAYSLKFEESNSDFEEFGEITPIGENVWFHFCVSYSVSTISVFKNGRLWLNSTGYEAFLSESIVFGGLQGLLTEIRIWQTQRRPDQIKEVYKCPLDILTEKRRKKWTNIKINKTELEKKTTLTLPKPESGPKLQPPKGLKPPGRLLAPPKQPVKDEEETKELI